MAEGSTAPKLGRVGIWSAALGLQPASAAREALAEVEELGFGAYWYPESPGSKESLSQGALLLSWTRRIVVASGIATIYARDPMAAANGAKALCEAYPGRFLLGLGVSHALSLELRGGVYDPRPLTAMRAYLDAMDAAAYRGPGPESAPRVLAALGPRMLELAATRTLGAHPYFVPVEHTAFAREALGAGPLLAPEQAVVLSEDASEARRIAREHMAYYLTRENYLSNLRRLGFGDDDAAGGGSDRLVDAIVAWGNAERIRDRVAAHLSAGADHVCIQVLGPSPAELPLADLRKLAPALSEL